MQKTLKLKNINFHLEDLSGAGPILLCLHGGPGFDKSSLMPGIENLTKLFQVVLMDLRGCGESSEPSNKDYALNSFSDDVIQIAHEIRGRKKIGVFGHSFGGFVAINALAAPSSPFSFSILSNTAMNSSWRGASKASMEKLNQDKLKKASEKFSRIRTDETFRELSLAYAPLYFPEVSKEQAVQKMNAWAYKVNPYLSASNDIFAQLDLADECKQIRAPVLIIGSDLDVIVPWRCQQELSCYIDGSKSALIKGAGHFPFQTKSEEFFKLVNKWWDKVPKQEET